MTTRETARRFHFLREIASGGFGSVFLTKVMHADGFSRLAAVKLLHRRWSENEEIARRMRDEARLLGWLRHRNIVDVVDLTSIDGRAAVIMEFLEAVDLKYIVQDMAERGELVPAKVAIEIMALVASALDAAYNRPPFPGEKPLRVIHRDIKPSNIMLDDVGMVKVLDFGVARADFESRESHTRELQFGSVDYMPPERLFFEPETPASDVYSLAASVYELLVLEKFGKARGRPQKHQAFVAERMAFMRGVLQVTSAQAEEIEHLVSTCLSYEHSERFTAADVYTKARALARRIEGPDLREWAESVIPPLVRAFESAPREANPLIDQVLNEDSHALDDGGDAVAAAAAASIAAAAAAAATGGDEVPRNDPRWEALRQAALAELKPSPDELPPAAPAPPPTPVAPPAPVAPPTPVPPPMPAAAPPTPVTLPTAPPPPPRPAMFSAPLPDPKPQPFLEPDLDDWADIPTRMELDPSLSAPPPPPPPPPAAPTPPPAAAVAPPPPAPVVATPADRPSSTWPPASEDDEATLLARFDRDDLASTQIESMVPPAVSAATSDAWAEPVAPPEPPMSVWPPPQEEPAQEEEEPAADDEQDEYDDEPEAPAPSPRNNLLIYGLVGVIVFTMVFTVGLAVLFMGPLKEALQNKGIGVPADGAVEEPAEPSEPKPGEAEPGEVEPKPAEPKVDAAPAGPHITFRSLAEGTRKLNVNCGAASGKGADVAHVEVAKAEKCAVTAILEKGRLQAVITDAKEGEYRCFEGGESRCVR